MTKFLFVILCLLGLISVHSVQAAPPPSPQHEVLICVSDAAPAEIKAAADEIANSAAWIPAIEALVTTQGAGPIVRVSSESVLKNAKLAAYNHLVIVGLESGDPLLAKVWGHDISVDETSKTVYAQGWGDLRGDIGTIESDWNPFLHSRTIKSAPFEAVEFRISGTSSTGVLAAVKAFESGLNNGLAPAGPVSRPETTILDLDPNVSPPPFALPGSVPATGAVNLTGDGAMAYAGWVEAPANEYRAYIDVAGDEPAHVWRAKYLQPGVLDAAWTPQSWVDGFHPMAYGNAVTIAQFASADAASTTAAAIGKSGGWRRCSLAGTSASWQSSQPTDEVLPQSYGSVYAFSSGPYLILSSLPEVATAAIAQCMH